jgi:hypothetical protein
MPCRDRKVIRRLFLLPSKHSMLPTLPPAAAAPVTLHRRCPFCALRTTAATLHNLQQASLCTDRLRHRQPPATLHSGVVSGIAVKAAEPCRPHNAATSPAAAAARPPSRTSMLPGLFLSGAYRRLASVSRRTTDGSSRGRPSVLCRPWPAHRQVVRETQEDSTRTQCLTTWLTCTLPLTRPPENLCTCRA